MYSGLEIRLERSTCSWQVGCLCIQQAQWYDNEAFHNQSIGGLFKNGIYGTKWVWVDDFFIYIVVPSYNGDLQTHQKQKASPNRSFESVVYFHYQHQGKQA